MKCWTCITKEELNALKKDTVLLCDDTNPNVMANEGEQFTRAYEFMSKCLNNISKNPFSTKYPRWIWYILDNKNSIEHINQCFFNHNTDTVYLLELNISDEDVLLSDYDLWHIVLMNGIITDNEIQDDNLCYILNLYNIEFISLFDIHYLNSLPLTQLKIALETRELIQKSWYKIFDINDKNPYIRSSSQFIQGVTWGIYQKQVTNIYEIKNSQKDIDKYLNGD